MGIAAYPFDVAYRYTKFFDPAGAGFFNIPQSDSGSEDQGLIQGEPGSYNFVLAPGLTPETGQAFNDWRGEANDAEWVIRWRGPSGRYRKLEPFPDFQRQHSNFIISRGQILALAPGATTPFTSQGEKIIGACVTDAYEDPDWPGRPLLNIITDPRDGAFPREWRMYRRPADIANDDSSLFDPIDAPDGWKQIGAAIPWEDDFDINGWTQRYAGSTFFNASGTEARMMIPLLSSETPSGGFEQAQIQFLTGTLSQFTRNRIGQGFRLTRTLTRTLTSSVNIDGQCGSALSTQNGSATQNATSLIEWTAEGSDVAWVDWKGDTPVFARWGTPTGGSGNNTLTFSLTCTGSSNVEDRGTFSTTGGGTSSDDGNLTVTVAGKTLTFRRVGGCDFSTESISITGVITRTGNIFNPPIVFCAQILQNGGTTTFKEVALPGATELNVILYSDLRHDLVVYREGSTKGRSTITFTKTDGVDDDPIIDTSLDFEQRTVVRFAGVEQTLKDLSGSSPSVINCAGLPGLRNTCDDSDPEVIISEQVQNPDPNQLGRSVSGHKQGIDVSRNGELLFFSYPEDFDISNTVINFLTGGDPVAITGVTGDNPEFRRIELVF